MFGIKWEYGQHSSAEWMQGSGWCGAMMNCLASLVVVLLACSEIFNVDARQTSSQTLRKAGEGEEPGNLFGIVFY